MFYYVVNHLLFREAWFCGKFAASPFKTRSFRTFLGIQFLKIPIQMYQIKTTNELVANNFHLTGSREVSDLIRFDNKVRLVHRSVMTAQSITIDLSLWHVNKPLSTAMDLVQLEII